MMPASRKPICFTTCLLASLFYAVIVQAQYTDTIYFNGNWQITEKAFAKAYRVGYVGYGNSYIIYTGKTTDHYADGSLQMEGNYSVHGLKTGPFKFYFPSGQVYTEGNYTNGLFDGDWTYYYNNGKKKSVINFDTSSRSFLVKEAYDSTGKATIKEGSGDFNLAFYDMKMHRYYRVEGEMNKGRRSGTWSYFLLYNGKEVRVYSEKYADGKIKKSSIYSLTGIQMRTEDADLHIITSGDFEKFRVVDSFIADQSVFNYLEETPIKEAVKNFLFDRTPVLIDAKGDSIYQSFNVILSKLNTLWLLRNFNDPYKDYNVSISFHISDSGTLHDFTLKGNFSPQERDMAIATFERFRNVKPIMIENVEVDKLHTIHFYSIHVAEMLPKRLQDGADSRLLIFTMIPRDKLVSKLKKDFKLQLRTNDQFINFINSNLRWQLRD